MIRLDKDGNILAAVYQDEPALASSFTLIHTNWFRTAQTGEIYSGNVQISATNTPYITMAFPTQDGGVVAGRVDMQVLWDVVANIRFGVTGKVFVVDNNGRILAHPQLEHVLNMTSLSQWSELFTLTEMHVTEWRGEFSNMENRPVLGTRTQLPNAEWHVITEVEQQEVYAISRSASTILVIFLLALGLVLSLLVISRLNAWLLVPIEQLRAGTERLGTGELHHRIQVNVHNELGQVANSFNQMAAQLENRTHRILKQQQELADEVAQRRRVEADLLVARDRALDASRTKSEFLATMSHEIRTPMHGIIGTTELMAATPLDDVQTDYLRTISSSASVLLTLLNDILDLSKIEAGRLTLDLRVFSVHQEIQNVLEIFNGIVKQKGITLQSKIAPDLPKFFVGDSVRVRQVLLNLVGNAVKFTELGSVTIEVSPAQMPARLDLSQQHNGHSVEQNTTEQNPEEYLSICFKVVDTGIGIAAADQKFLFQPFKQLGKETLHKHRGTGLGLSITKRLVELMGGEIGVISQAGQGSAFWFSVPFARTDETAFQTEQTKGHSTLLAPSISSTIPSIEMMGSFRTDATASQLLQKQNSRTAGTASFSGPSILVAEDNLVNQKLVMKLLTNLGYSADLVSNGREAVEAFSMRPYDLILMDCQMPDMNGFEATTSIRKTHANSSKNRVPIIAMTANAMEGDRQNCLAVGMDDFLAKPFRTNDLREILERWSTVQKQPETQHTLA